MAFFPASQVSGSASCERPALKFLTLNMIPGCEKMAAVEPSGPHSIVLFGVEETERRDVTSEGEEDEDKGEVAIFFLRTQGDNASNHMSLVLILFRFLFCEWILFPNGGSILRHCPKKRKTLGKKNKRTSGSSNTMHACRQADTHTHTHPYTYTPIPIHIQRVSE